MRQKSYKKDRRNGRGFSVCILILALICLIPIAGGYKFTLSAGEFLAPDGTVESFTPEVYSWLRAVFSVLFLVLMGLFITSVCIPERFFEFWREQWRSFKGFPSALKSDTGTFFSAVRQFFRENRKDIPLLLILFLSGMAIRLWIINRPITHDEAYTITTWGSGSLKYAVSDYQLPNNHVFHTILVNLIYHTLGKTPALLRLPALINGLLLIPAVYILGKQIYNSATGLLAAGISAFSSFLIDYSVWARGYSILAFCAVLIFIEGTIVQKQKNRFVWCLLILTAVIGFYTLPVMLYPFGAFCVWFLLRALFYRKFPLSGYGSMANALKYFIAAGIVIVILTGLCYLPILRNSGIHALFGNVFVRPLPLADFKPTLISRAIDFYRAFTDTVPPVIRIALFLGNVLALIFHRKISRIFIPLQAAFLLWLLPLWAIQRPNLWPRTLIFLWPFLILWGSAGVIWIVEKICAFLPSGLQTRFIPLFIIVAAGVTAVPQFDRAAEIAKLSSPHETAVLRILENRDTEKILFVVAPEDDAPLWYYADRYGLPKSIFDKNIPFSTVYVYVNPKNEGFEEPRTLDEIINRYGPGESFLDRSTEKVLMASENAILYRFHANERVIRKTFGETP